MVHVAMELYKLITVIVMIHKTEGERHTSLPSFHSVLAAKRT